MKCPFWTVAGVAAVAVVASALAVAAPAAASDPRGSEKRIADTRAQQKKSPRDARIACELGANLAVKYADTREKSQRAEALYWLDEAAKLDPKLAAPDVWRGLVYVAGARGGISYGPVHRGLALMDDAVHRDPGDLDVRMVRASVDIELPRSFSGRLAEALADLELVAARASKDAQLARKYDIDLTEVYTKLGIAKRASGDLPAAREAWQKAVAIDANTSDAKHAARLLAKYGAR